ncbi:Stk1 family PASTA domain-containing Ser/Thr kinase [Ruminococcus albus]|uniref:non-specific serine/threonine protein kinase n=1 Tax=Ruminococcus albus TaxID=1264 RepID=A0A1I1HWN5_RUMAL|nr:PASTA domain-containing protein [Ruminococcus albus]SFC28261.1 PASTA domain, binds beta-lactams [Ruminococcus albus]
MKYCMGCMEQYEDEYNICPHCGYAENTPPVNSLQIVPGSILADRYIVGRSLGSGGFGVTYIGWDALLETKVAIKEYLPSEFSSRAYGSTEITVFSGAKQEQFESGMNRFVDEAKKLAKFGNSSGIVQIIDTFEVNNTAYIIMELLEGETLAQRLEREKTIPPEEALRMITPVINSLEEVHKAGLIHRDIAPDNIFITSKGDIKLIDFGAARFATSTHSRSLTVLVKEGYSPEEQYESRGEQGPHTDVYALAATLYRMITGVVPPAALERKARVRNRKKDPLQPPSKFVKDLDDNYENALMNALNIQISDRTESMSKFLEELTSEQPVKRRLAHISVFDKLKWPLWAKIGVPAACVCLLTFGVLFMTGVIRFDANMKKEITIPEGQTRVPSVLNLEYPSAEMKLSESNLNISVTRKEPNRDIPENRVMKQMIFDGSVVAENTVVQVVISAGEAEMIMPNVLGLEADTAKNELENLGLKVTVNEEYDDSIMAGSVISQSKDFEDKVYETDEIVLTVSKGRDPFKGEPAGTKAPNFLGSYFEEARQIASENDVLIMVTEYRYSRSFAKGQIMSQNPGPGGDLDDSKCVKLVISMGFGNVTVPDVTFQDEDKAKTQLRTVGLIPQVTYEYSNSIEEGLVISQDPSPDTSIETGSKVNLVISKGAESVEIPNLVGMTKSDATDTLRNMGMVVVYEYKTDNSKSEDSVLSSSPAAGEKIRPGSEITLTICTHESTVQVPDVKGKSRSDAEKAIKSAGLKVNVVEVIDDDNVGKVISQSPKGRSSTTKGKTVTINVGKKSDDQKSNNNGSNGSNNGGSSKTTTKSETTTQKPETTPTKKTNTDTNSEPQTETKTETNTSSPQKKKYTVKVISESTEIFEVEEGATFGSVISDFSEGSENSSGQIFKGWYIGKNGNGRKVSSSDVIKSDTTVFAYYVEPQYSDWTPISDVPSGAKISEHKYTFYKPETTTSESPSLGDDWKQTGSEWKESGSATRICAEFPSGFDESNAYYNDIEHGLTSAYADETSKRDVSRSFKYYIYWHWCYPLAGSHTENDRIVSDQCNEKISGCGYTTIFEAFDSTVDEPYKEWAKGYEVRGHSTYSWWYVPKRVEVYEERITDYKKIYTYSRSVYYESDTQPNPSTVINLTHLVKYRIN